MRYLYKRGRGARRRVMHITPTNRFGRSTMVPLCGRVKLDFDSTCNLPLGQRVCKRCRAAYETELAS